MTSNSRSSLLWLLAIPLCVLPACGHQDLRTRSSPKSPGIGAALLAPRPATTSNNAQDSKGHVFFPLRLGNRWHYAVTIRRTWLPSSDLPDSVMIFHRARARELICTETQLGREYVVEQRTEWRPEFKQVYWVQYRQDRSGLYQDDPPTSRPPKCAGLASSTPSPSLGTPDRIDGRPRFDSDLEIPRNIPEAIESPVSDTEAEIGDVLGQPGHAWNPLTGTRILQYPLHTGAEWQMDMATRVRVEGLDVLNLPAGRFVAYRLSLHAHWMHPGEEIRLWYGRAGYLGSQAHTLGISWLGAPVYWADETEVLDTLALNDREDAGEVSGNHGPQLAR